MIKSINGKDLITVCNFCGHEKITNVDGMVLRKNEFNEYDNLNIVCPNCGGGVVFNMNIPADDIDEPFLPEKEKIQRYYIRHLMRLIREDFVEGGREDELQRESGRRQPSPAVGEDGERKRN